MYKSFVYLKLSDRRLVIVNKMINDSDYFYLMHSEGNDYKLVMDNCKSFCMGFIRGSEYGEVVVNSDSEFQ